MLHHSRYLLSHGWSEQCGAFLGTRLSSKVLPPPSCGQHCTVLSNSRGVLVAVPSCSVQLILQGRLLPDLLGQLLSPHPVQQSTLCQLGVGVWGGRSHLPPVVWLGMAMVKLALHPSRSLSLAAMCGDLA